MVGEQHMRWLPSYFCCHSLHVSSKVLTDVNAHTIKVRATLWHYWSLAVVSFSCWYAPKGLEKHQWSHGVHVRVFAP
jgi:hypothetical protein